MKCARIFASALLPTLVLAAGCHTAGSAKHSHAAYHAVVSTSSNGGPIVFLVPTETGKKPEALSKTSAAVCEGCRAEADRYFRTGAMATNCPICNASLTAVNGR